MAKAPSRVPRGRHAPPREVREELQRERLFEAAARVFSQSGYADTSAEAISRAAGMSKATFYEHFGNKRDCLLEIMDEASRRALEALVESARHAGDDPLERHRAGLHAFLQLVAGEPEMGRTVLIVSVGAGQEALERRDAILEGFATVMFDEAREGVEKRGVPGRLPIAVRVPSLGIGRGILALHGAQSPNQIERDLPTCRDTCASG